MDTLLTIGGFTPLPYIFYSVIQSARQRGQINFFGALLALAAALIPVGLVGWMVVSGASQPVFTVAALASAGVVLLFSLFLMVRDARQHTTGLNQSYGLLGLGVGVLVIAGVLALPLVLPLVPGVTAVSDASDSQTQTPLLPAFAAPAAGDDTAAQTADTTNMAFTPPAGFALPGGAASETAASDTSASEASAQTIALPAAPAGFAPPALEASAEESAVEASATEAPAAESSMADMTEARQARFTYEDFATQVFARISAESTAIPALAAFSLTAETPEPAADDEGTAGDAAETPAAPTWTCVVTVNFNLNLRTAPSVDAERLLTIPYTSVLAATERTDDNWWHVTYEGIEGWVSGEYLTADAACAG
ncbi:MAG: SH3 domain-containing protein [Anaerolineae bacterium]|nr:SH3 domain-containing protein [Anaerolineae bacterium]